MHPRSVLRRLLVACFLYSLMIGAFFLKGAFFIPNEYRDYTVLAFVVFTLSIYLWVCLRWIRKAIAWFKLHGKHSK